eukprot:gene13143-8989_t
MPQFERANNLTPPIKDYNEQSNTKSKKPTLKLKNPSANINNQQSHGTLPTTLNNTTYHNHCQALLAKYTNKQHITPDTISYYTSIK